MAELAVATGTMPSQWEGESDEMLVTVIDVLADQAEQIKSAGKRHKGK